MSPLCALFLLSLPMCVAALSDRCTAIAVGHGATIEGSALATHNNDCDTCDPRLAFISARDHPHGARRPVAPLRLLYPRFVGAHRSETYAPVNGQKHTEPIGYIDEVPHTYSYWEGSYPLVNEHGLGFGESTCAAFLVGQSKMDGGEALFSVAELMQVALERCKTARCAIQVMGNLGVQHGFYGEDPGEDGAGESLTVADADEIWVFHITGGLKNTSATWVAQKVPSDHVSVVANGFIIQKVNCADEDQFMCSENLFSNAKDMNLCEFETEMEFNFMKCYSPDVRTYASGGFPAIPYYTTLRQWGIMNLANPNLAVPLSDNAFLFPFSVPVAKKVSRADVMNWTRYYYQGTEFDMSQGVLAGPFGNPNRVEGGVGMREVKGVFTRGISIQRTNYAVVVEAKEKADQSIVWFSADQPLTGVFAPVMAASTRIEGAYQRGRLEIFSRDSAFWAFNFVSNWMNNNFKDMMEMTVGPTQRAEQQHILSVVERMEANWPDNIEAINEAQHTLQKNLVDAWWNLADKIVAQFSDGHYYFNNGTTLGLGYSAAWLEMIGFNVDFTSVQWVKWSPVPPVSMLKYLPVPFQSMDFTATFMARTGQLPSQSMLLPMIASMIFGILIGAGGISLLRSSSPKDPVMASPLLAH